MTYDELILREIRDGRTSVCAIRHSRPYFMRFDIQMAVRRLRTTGKIKTTTPYGRSFALTRKGLRACLA